MQLELLGHQGLLGLAREALTECKNSPSRAHSRFPLASRISLSSCGEQAAEVEEVYWAERYVAALNLALVVHTSPYLARRAMAEVVEATRVQSWQSSPGRPIR